jgi:hypothetical protein
MAPLRGTAGWLASVSDLCCIWSMGRDNDLGKAYSMMFADTQHSECQGSAMAARTFVHESELSSWARASSAQSHDVLTHLDNFQLSISSLFRTSAATLMCCLDVNKPLHRHTDSPLTR